MGTNVGIKGDFRVAGFEKFLGRLTQAKRVMKDAAFEELAHIADEVLVAAREITPMETGALRSTLSVEPRVSGNTYRLELKAGGPAQPGLRGDEVDYAIYVHEDLSKYHTPPTSAKFLERPYRAAAPKIASRLAKAAREAMK